MKLFSKHYNYNAARKSAGFTLIEVVTAVAILAFISSSVVIVIDRSLFSAAEMKMKMNAFQVARENMEQLLAEDSVVEKVEYGTSEEYPYVDYQTTVELTSIEGAKGTWVRATCIAEYPAADGETKKIELVHLLKGLSSTEAAKLKTQKDKQRQIAEQLGIEDQLPETPTSDPSGPEPAGPKTPGPGPDPDFNWVDFIGYINDAFGG